MTLSSGDMASAQADFLNTNQADFPGSEDLPQADIRCGGTAKDAVKDR